MSAVPLRPLPDLDDPLLAPFWEGSAIGEIRLQRCADCGTFRWPPRPVCATCWSFETTWSAVRPTGVVYSWVTIHHALAPAFADVLPYAVAIVELDEGPRVLTAVPDSDRPGIAVGQRVDIGFEDVGDGVTLLVAHATT